MAHRPMQTRCDVCLHRTKHKPRRGPQPPTAAARASREPRRHGALRGRTHRNDTRQRWMPPAAHSVDSALRPRPCRRGRRMRPPSTTHTTHGARARLLDDVLAGRVVLEHHRVVLVERKAADLEAVGRGGARLEWLEVPARVGDAEALDGWRGGGGMGCEVRGGRRCWWNAGGRTMNRERATPRAPPPLSAPAPAPPSRPHSHPQPRRAPP